MNTENTDQNKGVAIFDCKVPAGFPSGFLDGIEERIDLNKQLVPRPLSTFIVESTGTSMMNAFIPPKAKLVVDRSITPKNGDIVLAVLDGEFTVKFLKKNTCKCWLVPANPKFDDIEITAEMDLQIWGVVTSIITSARDVRSAMF